MDKKQELKGDVRLFLKKCLRGSLRAAEIIIPVKKNKILFYAGARGYICSPKYVAEYLNDHYPGKYELCWIGKDEKQLEGKSYLKLVKVSPFSLFYALASSKVFVTNGENAICPKSKKKLIICTWHGAAYKKVGFDTKDKFSKTDTKHSAINILLSISQEYTTHLIKSGFHYNGRILNCGYPRNDIFFDKNKVELASNKIRDKYHLTGKVILFAPTYRGVYQTANKVDFKLDFSKLKQALIQKYGDKVTILVRMHYFDKNQYDLPDNAIDVGNWPDMQELLCATDILITDYSSTIWDFALTKKPCLLYVPDLHEYETERGLYTDPRTWPGVLCMNMEELSNAIINLDEASCAKKAEEYLKNVCSYENGTATQQVCNEIVNYIDNSK